MKPLKSPRFLGIGCQKSGTSWLWKQIKNHPQVGTPRLHGKLVKEMHYIDRLNLTLSQYMAKFGRLNTFTYGEYTPNYICTPYAPAMIKTYFPDVKLFAIFRNPADRAFSHYKDHLYYRKIPDIKFLDAFYGDYPKKMEANFLSIKNKGMYGDQLELWYNYFPREQLKFMFYEDMINNPIKFIQDIYEHIGVEKNYLPPKYDEKVVKRYNRAFDSMKFEERDREEVVSFYKLQIKKLSDLTGRKLDW